MPTIRPQRFNSVYTPDMELPSSSSAPIDLINASFDDFVRFLFEREELEDQGFDALCARGERKKWKPWYFETEVLFDSLKICPYYSRLFLDARFLLNRFPKAQLDQGFRAIQSCTLDCSAFQLISDETLPFDMRTEVCALDALPIQRPLLR